MYKKLYLLILLAICLCKITLAQTTQIRGFVNFNAYYVHDTIKETKDLNFFRLGQYDLFITSQVTDKISFLGESVFEFDGDFGVDVERLFAKYTHSDHFAI